jgi:hypothetical protein
MSFHLHTTNPTIRRRYWNGLPPPWKLTHGLVFGFAANAISMIVPSMGYGGNGKWESLKNAGLQKRQYGSGFAGLFNRSC